MVSQVLIRPAQNSDTQNLTQLNSRLGYHANEKTVFSILEKVLAEQNQQVFLAELNGAVVGYIHLVQKNDATGKLVVDIAALVIHESSRGRGAGSGLIDSAVQWILTKNISCLQIRSSLIQPSAYRFFEDKGFLHITHSEIFVKEIPSH